MPLRDVVEPGRGNPRPPHPSGVVTPEIEPARRRDQLYRIIVRALAVALLPVAYLAAPRLETPRLDTPRLDARRRKSAAARRLACRWALTARFPAEDLAGLTPATRDAFEAARTRALWRDGELIGLTSGHRAAHEQARLFLEAVRRAGSTASARRRVLPPDESRHVEGTALDVRPAEGARWLERHGHRYDLYRVYDNEWWHFEHHPDGVPQRRPHPGAPDRRRDRAASGIDRSATI